MTSLGLVITQFYEELAEEMEAVALEKLDSRTAELAETVYVRGVYDTPLAADRLARRENIDAVAVLGAVITGDTDHDQVVARTAASKLSDVSLNRDTPVTFGIIGPGMSSPEAYERIEYGAEAIPIALKLVSELP
ncbi:6,7-dimethyl-8-ribityllumazine synthase [Natronosalvus rutilus]|uniref:6,7-dimethyl-8-ribityllumazine synthase n=1 Tax=Natronosalvus rutilus TaxID=2953753 RepID=A0A9E7SWZ4_9EURY|nr:6,7-dimethyl-8-ribityllumazine synthase [Natronosalvus rutilus]UTF55632.1 6,7-dimethyl-8-ribityllumazine synthase [Natronosalvus rutilus]